MVSLSLLRLLGSPIPPPNLNSTWKAKEISLVSFRQAAENYSPSSLLENLAEMEIKLN
jgi:hypothetical protein